MFIDGPTERSGKNGKKCFNADFLNILARTEDPVHGMIDQRITTYWAFKKLMPTAKIRYDVIKKLTSIIADKDDLKQKTFANDRIP